MGIHIDTSEVDRLAVDLGEAPARLRTRVGQRMFNGARRVQRGMKRDASGHRFLPELSDYVAVEKFGQFEYEIGFDKAGQGNLANIAAFGSVNNAPVMDHTASLRRETPSITEGLGDDAEDSVLGGRE